jgi:hypothetical protein
MKTCFVIFLVVLILFDNDSFSQIPKNEINSRKTDIGFGLQFYPAGIITTVNAEIFLEEKSSLFFRSGGNFIDRKDFSTYNENEKGIGFGSTIGYRTYFNIKKGSLVYGLYTDFWSLWINWKNNTNDVNQTQGKTYILVLQPWAEAGYFFNIKQSRVDLGISTGFGREINIVTKGKQVEQGWINSVLLHVEYSIRK